MVIILLLRFGLLFPCCFLINYWIEILVNWFQIYLVVVGVVTIILSVLIFTTPGIGELYIVILVAVGFLITAVPD